MIARQQREQQNPKAVAAKQAPTRNLLFALVFSLFWPLFAFGLADGDKIPTFTLMTGKGHKISLAQYAKSQKKKNLLLVFFRTGTCGVCVRQLIELSELHEEIATYDAAVLALSVDDAIIQGQTAEKISHRFPILLDPDAKTVKKFGVFNPADNLSRPALFLVGPERKILYHYVGQSMSDRPPTATVMHAVKHYSGLIPKTEKASQ